MVCEAKKLNGNSYNDNQWTYLVQQSSWEVFIFWSNILHPRNYLRCQSFDPVFMQLQTHDSTIILKLREHEVVQLSH
jgi:hypothetical protein